MVCGISSPQRTRPPLRQVPCRPKGAAPLLPSRLLTCSRHPTPSHMGEQVVLAANEEPSCNDILASELIEVLKQASQLDDTIRCDDAGIMPCRESWLPVK